MPTTQTDRIEKQMSMKAAPSRVWRAISDHEEFGTWFRVKLDGPFVPGQTVTGKLTEPGYEGMAMDLHVDAVEPETKLVFRWAPYAIDPDADYSQDPLTTITITVEPEGTGTKVTIVEAGFDALPAARRAEAFTSNAEGWQIQLGRIAAHVGG